MIQYTTSPDMCVLDIRSDFVSSKCPLEVHLPVMLLVPDAGREHVSRCTVFVIVTSWRVG